MPAHVPQTLAGLSEYGDSPRPAMSCDRHSSTPPSHQPHVAPNGTVGGLLLRRVVSPGSVRHAGG